MSGDIFHFQLTKKQANKLGLSWAKLSSSWDFKWPPLWIIFKGKIKIAHLLPEQSVHQDDHFLQT